MNVSNAARTAGLAILVMLSGLTLGGRPAQGRPSGWPSRSDAEVKRDGALVQVTRTMSLELAADADTVFPLFGPVREAEWSPGWKPGFVVPDPGLQSAEGAVFTTGPADSPIVWVMTDYDPSARIVRYVHTIPGQAVTQMWIEVSPGSPQASRADVTYRFTALSAPGRDLLARFATGFPGFKAHWEHAIGSALAKGTGSSGAQEHQ